MSMHSVRLEPTKLSFTGTRTTYQATGDAGYVRYIIEYRSKVSADPGIPIRNASSPKEFDWSEIFHRHIPYTNMAKHV